MKITYEEIKKNETINTYIKQADENLKALGFTEHSFAHVGKVACDAGFILSELDYDEETIELAKIAGYMHDIGNVVNRIDHAQSGAVMAFRILDKIGADDEDIAKIVAAKPRDNLYLKQKYKPKTNAATPLANAIGAIDG